MSPFVIAYSVVWTALAIYVVRQHILQRRLMRVVDELLRDSKHQL